MYDGKYEYMGIHLKSNNIEQGNISCNQIDKMEYRQFQ